jgi:uncharacterized protein (TIGR03437 family)
MRRILLRASGATSLLAVAGLSAALLATRQIGHVMAQTTVRFDGPTSSQPLALSADDALLLVANPDNNSVSLFDLKNGNTKLAEIPVGREPSSVALSPDGTRAYVSNTVDGTISVLSINRTGGSYYTPVSTITVGTEPYGIALTPTGSKLYVANARSNTVSVIDTAALRVTTTISNVGPEPRGIAITNAGTGADTVETVFVTQFLSLPIAGKVDGADDAKAGHVTVISAATDTVTGDIVINPLADTGIKAAGDALQRIAPPATPAPADFRFTTGAYPNQLANIAIRGRFAFLPNTGASPNGPVRFNVNTQSLLSVIDVTARRDAGKTINMHAAVDAQTNPAKRFITHPWAMAFKHKADVGYVISAASNIVVKVNVDSTGAPTVQTDPADATRVLEIPTGKNPRGIVVNTADTTAYVMNYVSRDVSVIDLSGSVERVTATLRSANLPTAGSTEDIAHVGKELYYTSVGEFDPATPGGAAITGRMSNNGWGSCGSCHPFGLSDNVVWIFPSGPKRTLPQHTDFDPSDTTRRTIRALNWSGERDEEADFELNIRAVSGGLGVIVGADGVTQEPNVANFTPLASKGRNQLKVRGVPAWDAIEAYIANGIRAPISPLRGSTDPDIAAGRQAFTQANCQSCHGGAQWTAARVRYNPPPDASLISNTQLIAELRNVGTFNAQAFNEVRQNGAPPLGADGFVPPSLLSLFAFPQTFFHNGSAASLTAVLQNVAHRTAGTPGSDTLTDAAKRAQLEKFILSIDTSTAPVAPAAPSTLSITSAAWNTGAKLAPDSLGSGYGTGLSVQTASATATPLPVSLAGSTLSVRDSAGVLRLAQLVLASPGQINFLLPGTTATGPAQFTAYASSGAVAVGNVDISAVAPSVFAMPGGNVAAAIAVRVSGNTQTPVGVFECASATSCTAAPIDLGAAGDQVFLTLFGTGLRKNSGLSGVRATAGGADAQVFFAGAQGEFAGLDQVNLLLPASLRVRGIVSVVLTIEGQTTNTVTVNVR